MHSTLREPAGGKALIRGILAGGSRMEAISVTWMNSSYQHPETVMIFDGQRALTDLLGGTECSSGGLCNSSREISDGRQIWF